MCAINKHLRDSQKVTGCKGDTRQYSSFLRGAITRPKRDQNDNRYATMAAGAHETRDFQSDTLGCVQTAHKSHAARQRFKTQTNDGNSGTPISSIAGKTRRGAALSPSPGSVRPARRAFARVPRSRETRFLRLKMCQCGGWPRCWDVPAGALGVGANASWAASFA